MRVNETRALNPGLLRHQIVWESKQVTGRNSLGEDTVEWMEVVSVRAQVVPMQGRELESAQQRWAEARYRIKQHLVAGLGRSQRLAWAQMDGTVKYLDPLDIEDQGGVGQVQVIHAKEWTA